MRDAPRACACGVDDKSAHGREVMPKTVPVTIHDLKIFRTLLQREADQTFNSYHAPGETDRSNLSDSAPHFVVIEYAQTMRAIALLGKYIDGGGN
jgi:hypothetical protein